MNKDEAKKYEVRMGLECCSVIDSKAGCIDCPYRYRCGALVKDAHKIIIEQEKKIKQLTIERNQCAEMLAQLCKHVDELLKEYEK